ncbi:glycine betaine ABC transporter substrate-binding protein [Thaumasiovibrio sp. DFM-14]|uniref:glycine betaine ABC transporter substrate-binding protein n=1 Tax=Thaumasiovibrio sp. DFM-14 TaxID=3384792 RepID=UPI0039A1C7CC
MKHIITLLVAITMALPTYANRLVVGGKGYTEQLLIATITSEYLRALGYSIDQRDGMGSTVLRTAQENGQVDLYWEYTGTGLITFNKVTDVMSPDEAFARLQQIDAEKGLIWLNRSKANNTYALAMRREFAEARNLKTISDMMAWLLTEEGQRAQLATNVEFGARDDGLKSLLKAYDFDLPRHNLRKMNTGLLYQALRDEIVEITMVFATDGRVKAYDFYILQDDEQHFPNYAMTPVVRQDTLDKNPDLADQLNALAAIIDDEIMSGLNARVDVDGISIERVAEEFLQTYNLR